MGDCFENGNNEILLENSWLDSNKHDCEEDSAPWQWILRLSCALLVIHIIRNLKFLENILQEIYTFYQK